jgi:hypothetical protein
LSTLAKGFSCADYFPHSPAVVLALDSCSCAWSRVSLSSFKESIEFALACPLNWRFSPYFPLQTERFWLPGYGRQSRDRWWPYSRYGTLLRTPGASASVSSCLPSASLWSCSDPAAGRSMRVSSDGSESIFKTGKVPSLVDIFDNSRVTARYAPAFIVNFYISRREEGDSRLERAGGRYPI